MTGNESDASGVRRRRARGCVCRTTGRSSPPDVLPAHPTVIPAKAGIHGCPTWIATSAVLAMNLDSLVATILALVVLVYLIYSLLRPERF
jgi:K+-transporting ATPase KdpF subunit